ETIGLKESPHLVEFARKYIANHPASSTSGRKDATPPTTSSSQLPTEPLKFGAFVVHFFDVGTFRIQGEGWPALSGNWKMDRDEVELTMSGGPGGCDGPGRYRVRKEGTGI